MAAAKRKKDARDRKDAKIIRKMKANMAGGMDKTKAIRQAYKAGAHRQAIGDVVGLSRERVYQIATGT